MLINRYKYQTSILFYLLISLTISVSQSSYVNAKQSNNYFSNYNQKYHKLYQPVYNIHLRALSKLVDEVDEIDYKKISGVSISIGSRSGLKITINPNRKYPVSAKQAIKIATQKVAGDVLKVKLVKGNYKINILTKKGLKIIYVSATTGKITRMK